MCTLSCSLTFKLFKLLEKIGFPWIFHYSEFQVRLCIFYPFGLVLPDSTSFSHLASLPNASINAKQTLSLYEAFPDTLSRVRKPSSVFSMVLSL